MCFPYNLLQRKNDNAIQCNNSFVLTSLNRNPLELTALMQLIERTEDMDQAMERSDQISKVMPAGVNASN